MRNILRKIFFLILLSFYLPFTASAQREYSPNFAIGAKAGGTMSRMSFSPEVHQKFTNGLTMGVTARYTEERFFGLIAEINLTQRGWAEDFARDEAPEFSYSRTLTYIQIPLLTHIYFGSKKFRGFVNLGPEFGYMIGNSINANFDYDNYASIQGFPQGYRTNEQLNMEIQNKFDYGIAAGIGMEWILKRKHSFFLEGRYYYGLGNIFKATKRDFFAASRGMSIELTLGYMIRIK
ncbi:MAG: PorT family protein [Duncaniella sp.]|nr:PorT family protein [Duncaniella sp.]MDE7146554.1 PorT family protein [Duncaniella sp.]